MFIFLSRFSGGTWYPQRRGPDAEDAQGRFEAHEFREQIQRRQSEGGYPIGEFAFAV